MSPLARTASRDEDYERLGLARDHIAPWEDGMRTSGGPSSYEWWYFDSHLDGGVSLVIVFYTKDSLATWSGLHPYVSVELDRPGEAKKQWLTRVKKEDFSASKQTCDVRIGASRFAGDLDSYTIHVEAEGVVIDVDLKATTPAWRPETGHFYFGAHDDHLFAWLPSVPEGRADIRITQSGTTEELSGTGYHDHNWGDASMMRLMNQWYWGRAQAGGYTVIASWLVGKKKYGHTQIPIFMLARDGKIVADDAGKVQLRLEDVFTDEKSSMPIPGRTIYEYTSQGGDYRVTLHREQTLLDMLPSDVDSAAVRALVKVARIAGGYIRLTGDITVERLVDGVVAEEAHGTGIWELTYFDHAYDIAGQ